jgi:hypothetical protein
MLFINSESNEFMSFQNVLVQTDQSLLHLNIVHRFTQKYTLGGYQKGNQDIVR